VLQEWELLSHLDSKSRDTSLAIGTIGHLLKLVKKSLTFDLQALLGRCRLSWVWWSVLWAFLS
jgi:hypothetical protein